MVKATKGVLIHADESIMAIIKQINERNNNAFVQEMLDDENCLVKENNLNELKRLLKERVKDVVKEAEDSGSE